MMMKRVIAIVAATVLMVTCAACGGGAVNSDILLDIVADGLRTVCAACEWTLDGKYAFCPHCGAADVQTVCVSCNQELAGNFAFCPHCGASTSGASTDEGTASANKNTATTQKGGTSNSGSTNKATASTGKNNSSNKGSASTGKVNSTVSTAAGGSSNNSSSNNSGSNSRVDINDVDSTPRPTYSSSSNASQTTNSDGLKYSDNEDVFKNTPADLVGKMVLFSDFGEVTDKEYEKVIAKFTTDTGIKVKMVQFLNTEYISKVSQQIAAGKAPDIAVCNATFPAALEMVQPLPSYFDVNDGFWDKRVSEATKVKGKYYFVNTINSPFTGGYVVYYNKTLFYNAGLKTPQDYYDEGAWSWENFKRVAQDCVYAGYKGAMFDPAIMAQQMGGDLLAYDPASSTFSGNTASPNFIKAMQFYANGLADGVFVSGSAQNFARGGVGMTIAGTYGLKYDGYFSDMLPSQIGVLPCPSSFDGKKLDTMPLGYRGYGICKGAENGKAAYYLLRYFLDLDKYEPAGVNVFVNKALEKYFRQKQLVQFQNSPVYFSHLDSVLSLIGKGWSTTAWKGVKTAPAGAITVELTKLKNVVDTAVSAANQKIKDYAR